MEYANLNIRTPKETKIKAEKIFEQLGITTTAAFNIFLKQVISNRPDPAAATASVQIQVFSCYASISVLNLF